MRGVKAGMGMGMGGLWRFGGELAPGRGRGFVGV